MKALMIPGSGEALHSRNYKDVLSVYRINGYEPEFISITWKYRTITDWIDQARKEIGAYDAKDILLSGFSYGAMIAFALAAETTPSRLFLFSLSPYFIEDMPFPKRYGKWVGPKKLAAFKTLSSAEIAQSISCPTTFFIGSYEKTRYPQTWNRIKDTATLIQNSEIIEVPGAGHDVGHENYLKAIQQAMGEYTNDRQP